VTPGRLRDTLVSRVVEPALAALPYVSEATGRFYFGKAREYRTAGILATSKPEVTASQRLDVIDLPSLSDRDIRSLIVNALLAEEWSRARAAWMQALEAPTGEDTRVPTFIVLEEAHNLVPAEAPSQREHTLREQFRTIAAEGRKYGLFLILVTQRPDKIDPLVVSECENKALLRLDSEAVLDVTRRVLGLEAIAPRTLDRCLDFGIGRALLIGRWAPEGQVLYAAARRTVEGGRNLRPEHWATPHQPIRAAPKRAAPKRAAPKRAALKVAALKVAPKRAAPRTSTPKPSR